MNSLFSACLVLVLAGTQCLAQIRLDTISVISNNKQLYAIVVSKNNKIVYRHYFNGKSESDIFNNQSLTKSVISLLVGIAIEKGFIKSADEKIVDFFPDLKRDTDIRKQNITIREIMNQTSGLWHETLGINNDIDEYLKFSNPSGYVLSQPLVTTPGSTFQYSNAASHLLSVIITKATGMSTLEFAEKYLLKPLNITNVKWAKMNDGYYDGGGLLSIHLSTVDLNKIGSLLLHRGYYHRVSVVPQKWVQEILHPTVCYHSEWGFSGSTYALCFYHYNYKQSAITYGLGWGGQYILVIPGKNAVITVNESINDESAIKAANIFLNRIFPMIFDQLIDNQSAIKRNRRYRDILRWNK